MASAKKQLKPYDRTLDESLWNFIKNYQEELQDSLYSLWEGGGKPYVKQMDAKTYNPSVSILQGGSAPSFKGDSLFINKYKFDDFVAEMSHAIDKTMPSQKKQELISKHYEKVDTTGISLEDLGIDINTPQGKILQKYNDPNLKRNPRPDEYIAHKILENWLYKTYGLDKLYKQYLSNDGDLK